MAYQIIEDLNQITNLARQECQGNIPISNLIIKCHFSLDLIDNPFEGLFIEDAKLWQAPQKPDVLQINHGNYIHKYGDGILYVINHIKDKPNSNRALLSLLNMGDIINSGDLPIPSFMIAQFSTESNDLYCTTYFRSLEVSKFLPINITEVCLIAQQIHREIPKLNSMYFCLHAFKATYNPDFDCLQKAEIDRQPRGLIAATVVYGNKEKIKRWVESKFQDTSVIEIDGIDELYNALISEKENGSITYSDGFITAIGNALGALKELQYIRTKASYGLEVRKIQEEVRNHLRKALERL